VNCDACNESAKERVLRMRHRNQQRRRKERAMRDHENAGLEALKRSAYDEAIFRYQQAAAKADSFKDKQKHYFMTALVFTCSSRPHLATPWFERVVETCIENGEHKLAAHRLRYLARQASIELRTRDMIPLLERAREFVSSKEGSPFEYRTDAMLSNCFTLLGDYDEANRKFWMKHSPGKRDHAGRIWYRCQRAILRATCGRIEEAFANFELALDHAMEYPEKEITKNSYTLAVLDDYAVWASTLGRIDIARGRYERALFIAREERVMWRIPYFSFRLASVLIQMGDYERARLLVTDANTYDSEAPILEFLRSIANIQLAQATENSGPDITVDNSVIELAFRSGEPQRVASITVLYAQAALRQGKMRRARGLIARGLSVISHADHAEELLALGAYGSRSDMERSRSILDARRALPNNKIATAYLALWEAYAAIRRRANHEAELHAQQAAEHFEELGCRHQQVQALQLIGGRVPKAKGLPGNRLTIFGKLDPTLTQREQEVAELVLQGLTNRSISETLSISERTVESHMTSILNRLGLRSRWQLTQL